MEFRGFPPASRDDLVKELGDKITVQESDWNCGGLVSFNEEKKPFDDARVRRALTLAIDRWGGVPALSKIAWMCTRSAASSFPGSPLRLPEPIGTARDRRVLAGYRKNRGP